jgi:hypothetical protein
LAAEYGFFLRIIRPINQAFFGCTLLETTRYDEKYCREKLEGGEAGKPEGQEA